MRRLFILLTFLLLAVAVGYDGRFCATRIQSFSFHHEPDPDGFRSISASPKARSGDVGASGHKSPVFDSRFLGGFGRTTDENGIERAYRLGVVQVKRRSGGIKAVRMAPGEESKALDALRKDPAVDFAELEFVLTRQSAGGDPEFSQQWHHPTIRSTNAWAISLGYGPERQPLVRLAILDTPFQMDHPDLRDHVAAGWSLITRSALPYETNGYYHSTIGAGLAGAVLRNGLGVAGVVNCTLVPVDIGNLPTTRDMHDAVIWAADNGIRVVNLSWDGAFSAVINEAGQYLKEKARGMLFMAGVNPPRFLNYPAHPHIYAISMTDSNDQPRSAWGEHVDFSAPGWDIYSTTTNSGYEVDSGTSYSSPLAAGVAAWVMSADPALGPDEIEGVLRESSVDLGAPGRDQRHGWGRIDFGKAARMVYERSAISRAGARGDGAEAVYEAGTTYRLLRSTDLNAGWIVLTNIQHEVTGGRIVLRDLEPSGYQAFYKVEITRPQ